MSKTFVRQDFSRAVQIIYPGADLTRDVIVQDDSDGNGPYLVKWGLAGAIPTDAAITAAMAGPRPDADVTGAINSVILKVLFNHENRIRALEAKAAITAAQFIAAIKALL